MTISVSSFTRAAAAAIIVKPALVFLVALAASMATAAELCPATDTKAEWSPQCFEGQGEPRRVKSAFLDRLRVDQSGTTTIFIGEPPELLAVDRHGKVVVPNIRHTGDFDYPDAYLGLGRFSVVGKDASGNSVERCGYFQSAGFSIVTPASYDHCLPFREDGAVACIGCVRYCNGADCQHSTLAGGRVVVLGNDGKVKREFAGPTLSAICGRDALARVAKQSNGAMTLRCETLPGHPFHM